MAAQARSFRSVQASAAPAGTGSAGGGPPRLTPLRELQLLEAHRAAGGVGPDAHRALTELLSGYQRRIHAICLRMVRRPEDAADLTQDVLLKLVENLDSYDGRSKLSTWVIRVAMNACLSHLRKGKVRTEKSLTGDHPASDRLPGIAAGAGGTAGRGARGGAGREPSPADSVEQEQQRTLVLRALDSLDADTRAVLVLRDVQDLDYQQLADVLEVPLGTVKSRLFRARASLRAAIEAMGGTA